MTHSTLKESAGAAKQGVAAATEAALDSPTKKIEVAIIPYPETKRMPHS